MRSQSQAIARAFAVVGATAALVLCASVPVRAEPAVTVYVPEDICATAWERMPAALRSKTVTIRGVKFDPSKLFELKCNEYKDDLVAKLREPFDKAKEEAAQQLRQPFDDLELGFKSWLAERMRRKMLPRLSPEERERFRRDSAFMQEKQQEWLADPNLETAEYIDAYAKENFGRLYDAYSKYVDLTNGQSKEMVDGLNGILKKAQDRLNRFLALKREAEADPETPWTDLLEKHGFSGSWVDRFKDYEGPIRDLNDRYKVTDAAQIIVGAFQTDDSTAKIDAMFELMATLSSVASDSKVPIVSLFGDIVAGYAKAAKEMLAAINALGERLKARAGYCFGPGVPLGRPGSDRYNEAYAATLQYPRLLLCPLGLGVAPWKDIYFQAAPAADDQLYFWSNSTAFDTGAPDGGGRIGVQETLKLMNGARALGYGVPNILAGNAGPIARVYNVPFSGEGGRRGIPGLMAEAREVMRDIYAKVSRLSGSRVYTGACSPDAVLRHIEAQTGINLAAFRDERDRFGLDRLVMTYAASYAAGRGAFGEGAGGRAGAYDHYRRIQQQLKNCTVRFATPAAASAPPVRNAPARR